ncbi:MAG: hypothetical protein LBN33_06445 [Desulfovibrio sp.]|nr:hypothetical protein [Desulfovibrio sp.]
MRNVRTRTTAPAKVAAIAARPDHKTLVMLACFSAFASFILRLALRGLS